MQAIGQVETRESTECSPFTSGNEKADLGNFYKAVPFIDLDRKVIQLKVRELKEERKKGA